MVTTIKITCDGVFIQTNANRSGVPDERIVSNTSMNVITDTNSHMSNGNDFNGTSNEMTKRSISVDDIDFVPHSLPNLPIADSPPALISPHLVKTLCRLKETAAQNQNKIVIDCRSPSSIALSTVSLNKSIRNVNRVNKNGHLTASITSNARQWDACGGKKNNVSNSSTTVRRRNTFKNYLIECKENIVRRLMSSTSPIG